MSEAKSFQEKCRRLGAKIKYYRTIAGLNQTALATKLGISCLLYTSDAADE